MTNSACRPSVNALNVMRSNGHTIFVLIAVITKEEKSWKWWKPDLSSGSDADVVINAVSIKIAAFYVGFTKEPGKPLLVLN